MDVFIMFRLNK